MMPNGNRSASRDVVSWRDQKRCSSSPRSLAGALAAGCGGGYGTKPAAATSADTAAKIVEMTDSTFAPDAVDVKVGETVTFVDKDEIAHTATAEGTFDSGTLRQGATLRLQGRRRPARFELRVHLPPGHDRDDQRHLVPSVDQTSSLVRTRSTTASVNSDVVACPPRSTVFVPVAVASSTDS